MSIKSYTKVIGDYTISIRDKGSSGILHKNPNLYNLDKHTNICIYDKCTNSHVENKGKPTKRKTKSGLCKIHKQHQNDLFLEVIYNNTTIDIPAHLDAIDLMRIWHHENNATDDYKKFIQDLPKKILGQIPDVTTLSGDNSKLISKYKLTVKSINDIYIDLETYINKFYSESDGFGEAIISYKKDKKEFKVPGYLLINIFIGLLLCEEANRGNRWFITKRKQESENISELGAALPLSYAILTTANWGVSTTQKQYRKILSQFKK